MCVCACVGERLLPENVWCLVNKSQRGGGETKMNGTQKRSLSRIKMRIRGNTEGGKEKLDNKSKQRVHIENVVSTASVGFQKSSLCVQ